MKEIILSILLCPACFNVSFCQLNKETLIKEVEGKLKTNKVTIAQFLLIKNMMLFILKQNFRNDSNRLLNFIPSVSSYRLFQELAASTIAI